MHIYIYIYVWEGRVNILCGIPRVVSRPCQCSLAAARAIDGGGSFAQIRQWGRGVELRLLRLHLRLGLWDLLLGAAVVVGFGDYCAARRVDNEFQQ